MHFLNVACELSQVDSTGFTSTSFATLGQSLLLAGTHFLLWKMRQLGSSMICKGPVSSSSRQRAHAPRTLTIAASSTSQEHQRRCLGQ